MMNKADSFDVTNGMQQQLESAADAIKKSALDRETAMDSFKQSALDRETAMDSFKQSALDHEEAKKLLLDNQAQLHSALAELGNQLKATIEAPEKILQSVMANFHKHFDDAYTRIYEPLRLLFVAADLYDALKEQKHSTAEAIIASPDFGVHLLHLLVRWTEMNEEERGAEISQEFSKAERDLETIKTGFLKRKDQIDKQVLITYFKEKKHVIKNSAELEKWPFDDWPLTKKYSIEIIKKWYKEAMPHIKLVGGRPKKENNILLTP